MHNLIVPIDHCRAHGRPIWTHQHVLHDILLGRPLADPHLDLCALVRRRDGIQRDLRPRRLLVPRPSPRRVRTAVRAQRPRDDHRLHGPH